MFDTEYRLEKLDFLSQKYGFGKWPGNYTHLSLTKNLGAIMKEGADLPEEHLYSSQCSAKFYRP